VVTDQKAAKKMSGVTYKCMYNDLSEVKFASSILLRTYAKTLVMQKAKPATQVGDDVTFIKHSSNEN